MMGSFPGFPRERKIVKFTAPELPERLKTDRYTDEKGNTAWTERFLLKRGICCGLGCRHCPYMPKHQAGNMNIDDELLLKKGGHDGFSEKEIKKE